MSAQKAKIPEVLFLMGAVLLAGVALVRAASGQPGGALSSSGQIQGRLGRPARIVSITFREELSIGVPEGDEAQMFGSSVQFNVDEKGNIYATDWDAKQIKKFGPDGKHLLTFGRKGQGPGEFQNPGVVRFMTDGTLYLSENFGNKMIFFNENGAYLKQSSLPADIFDIWITPAGTYLGNEQVAPQYVGEGPVENAIKVYDGNFKPILELHRESFIFPDRSLGAAQGYAQITNEFLARPTAMAVLGPDGRIFFARSDIYAIDVFTPEGRKLRTISRAAPALPYKAPDRDFLLKEEEERMKSLTGSETLVKEYLGLIRFPGNKPFIRTLVPMDGGDLAVVVDHEGHTAVWLDLFNRDGAFLGRVRAAIPPLNLMFKNGKAYALQKDEDGFLSIKRYSCDMGH
jgi:hypothetical protein